MTAVEAMSIPGLFDPLARTTDPETSHRAAQRVQRGWANKVIECLAMYGPASDDRICIRLNVDVRAWPSVKTARSRVTHHRDPSKRLIVDTGEEENGQKIWRHRDYRYPPQDVDVGDAL